MKEIFICIKHLNISYSDAMLMPVYERRMFIDFLRQENQETKEHYEELKQKNKGKSR